MVLDTKKKTFQYSQIIKPYTGFETGQQIFD